MPGFESDVIIAVQEGTGYLINTVDNKVITKEESLVIWKHLYKNKNLVGKIIVEDPIKEFLNKVIYIFKNNEQGNRELFKYMVSEIKEEIDNDVPKYRLFIQNIQDPLQEVEKSKTLLTLEQLKVFINENSKTEN